MSAHQRRHGFQVLTQPIWIVLNVLPFIFIAFMDWEKFDLWRAFAGLGQPEGAAGTISPFDIAKFGAASAVILALMTQIGEIARAGTTLVLVTHHLEELVPDIGHVVLLRAGRVLADGPRDTVLTDALLSQTFDAPVRIRRDANGTLALTMVD